MKRLGANFLPKKIKKQKNKKEKQKNWGIDINGWVW